MFPWQALASLFLVLTLLAPGDAHPTGLAQAQQGAFVLEDPLSGPGVVTAGTCPTQRNSRVFVGEGYMFKVTGPCTEAATTAAISRRIDGLTIPDGEILLDLKAVSGVERAQFRLWFRDQGSNAPGYYLALEPGRGTAQLVSWTPESSSILAEREDLAAMLAPSDWNTLALRLDGPSLSLSLNRQPALSAIDGAIPTGLVSLSLYRLGEIEDNAESAVVMRNLRVSALETGNPSRAPTYASPSPTPAAAATGGPPWISEITFGYDPSGNGAVPAGGSVPIVEGGTLYAFFSWQNLPPGSKIGLEFQRNGELYDSEEFTPSGPSGRIRVPIVRWIGGSGTGSADWNISTFELTVLLNGQEMAKGWVTPGGG